MGFDLLTAFVAARGSGDEGPQVQRENRTLERLEQPHQRRYLSIYGPLEIQRCVYGTREGQKIEYVPLDAKLGLPAGEISYVLEDWLERMCVKDAYRDSVDSLVELLGVRAKVSVETAEKHAREMAEHAASFRASQPLPPRRHASAIAAAKERRPTRNKWPTWERPTASIVFAARQTISWMNCSARSERKIARVLNTNACARR